MVGATEVADGAKWAWENRAAIADALSRFRRWWRRSRILVIGPGGTGKTTLARILSGEFDWLKDSPWRYDEDVAIKSYQVKGKAPAEVVVLPGQEHRRSSTWTAVVRELAAGKYRGVVIVGAYGYHSLSGISYKDHRLFRSSKDRVLGDYLADRRAAELACVAALGPGVSACPDRFWVVSAVAKQDLWRPDEGEADRWYRTGEYGQAVEALIAARTASRHEFVPPSLLISNYVTDRGEVPRKNAEGYDHRAQIESVRRLIERLDGLRAWEGAR